MMDDYKKIKSVFWGLLAFIFFLGFALFYGLRLFGFDFYIAMSLSLLMELICALLTIIYTMLQCMDLCTKKERYVLSTCNIKEAIQEVENFIQAKRMSEFMHQQAEFLLGKLYAYDAQMEKCMICFTRLQHQSINTAMRYQILILTALQYAIKKDIKNFEECVILMRQANNINTYIKRMHLDETALMPVLEMLLQYYKHEAKLDDVLKNLYHMKDEYDVYRSWRLFSIIRLLTHQQRMEEAHHFQHELYQIKGDMAILQPMDGDAL